MKDIKDILLERRIKELEIDGKEVPDKYIAVFNSCLEEIAESLSDHDKQVRKEAVKQVLDFIEEHKENYFEQRDYYGVKYIFFNRSNLEKDILDQIQGENNVKD